MKVLCISAKARHGKDTAANIIKDYLEDQDKKVLITHYGDLIKFICKNYFNWDGQKDEKGRTLMQYVGTDIISSKQPAYWVDFVISILKFFESEWDYVLVPDCRYPIEAFRMVENFDTAVLRIERPGFKSDLTETQLQHPSETAMDNYAFDAIIYNDAGFDELREKLIWFTNSFLID